MICWQESYITPKVKSLSSQCWPLILTVQSLKASLCVNICTSNVYLSSLRSVLNLKTGSSNSLWPTENPQTTCSDLLFSTGKTLTLNLNSWSQGLRNPNMRSGSFGSLCRYMRCLRNLMVSYLSGASSGSAGTRYSVFQCSWFSDPSWCAGNHIAPTSGWKRNKQKRRIKR